VIGYRPLDVSQLFAELANQLRANALLAIAAVATLTAASVAIETYAPAASVFVEGFLSLVVQYFVTRFGLAAARHKILHDQGQEALDEH